MSGKKDEIRSQRSAALADKKRRLDELKKRRSTRQQAESSASSVTSVSSTGTNASSTIASATSAVAASKNGNLDEYIDGLLNSTVPIGAPVVTSFMVQPAASTSTSTSTGTTSISTGVETGTSSHTDTVTVKSVSSGAGNTSTATTSAATSTATTATDSMAMNMNKPQVETFEICTQTNEDDFPILTSETNEEDDDKENDKDDQENIAQDEKDESSSSNENNDSNRKDNNNEIIPKLLNEEEVNETINTPKFTKFLNSASKKVERLLGSSILSDLLVDDVLYYTDLQSKHNDAASKSGSGGNSGKNAIVSAQVSFEYPKWTQGRDITSIDWSVHHRGEVMLASYHMSSSSGSNGSSGTGTGTAISSIIPNATPSSSLLPKSRSEITQADGLNIIWNLTMPNRPEHILTCGSPVLESKFHPTEGNLVVGACYSGQVVVWDVRSGRLPVQRSSLNLLGGSGSSSTGGHVHPVVGMEVLDGGSGFVTAASDGIINFWSLSNLIEPAESLKIPGGNLTSISVAPESQSIIAGDECGSLYAIVSSSTTTSGGGRSSTSSSTSRRTVRKLNNSKKDPGNSDLYHYGPVTGLSTRVTSNSNKTDGVSLSRGFARGAKGMVLTCGVDWTTKLWAPAYSDKPLLSLLSHSYDYMCDVQWSPMHPSVFATASSNGTLAFWNLASSIDEPVTGLDGIAVEKTADPSSSQRGVNKLKWSADGRRIAAACSDTLYVLGMSEDLWKPNGDEEVRLMSNLKGRGLLDEE